jgi:hypothetical protein
MPNYRRLAPQISPKAPSARMITGEVLAVNTTTKTATIRVGAADMKVGYPTSLSGLAVGDVLWCLETTGHFWPVAYNR